MIPLLQNINRALPFFPERIIFSTSFLRCRRQISSSSSFDFAHSAFSRSGLNSSLTVKSNFSANSFSTYLIRSPSLFLNTLKISKGTARFPSFKKSSTESDTFQIRLYLISKSIVYYYQAYPDIH